MVDKRDEADKLIDEMIAGKTPDEIVGEGGLLQALTKRIYERALEGVEYELIEHDDRTVERDYLMDALSRFGMLWDSLIDTERTSLFRQIVRTVTFDPDTQEVAIRFRLAPTE